MTPAPAPAPEGLREALDYLRMPEAGDGLGKAKYAVVPVQGDRDALAVVEAHITELTAALVTAREDAERAREQAEAAEDEAEELRSAPWPDWATQMLASIRKESGNDGYDDAAEGVDLPAELDDLIGELHHQQNGHRKARERATAAETALSETQTKLRSAEAALAEQSRLRGEAVGELTAGGLKHGSE